MKSIAILIPTLKKGGAEKQAVLLAKALKEKAKVTIIVPFSHAGFEPELVRLSGLEREDMVLLDGNRQIALFKCLQSRHIDTLFCYLTWPDFWGPVIGRLAGVKTIYQGLRNAELPSMKLILERIGNLFSTGAVTNNYAGAETFSHKGIRRQVVIPNCYINIQEPFQRENKDEITVITVGRFVAQKDYPTAISAMAVAMGRNKMLRFKIIGHGELENEVRQLVKQHGIEKRTEILINPPGILGHLHDADIYLSTSLFEGTSNSIMEAMDASLPIVATDAGDNSHMVFNGRNGFLTQIKDVGNISDAIVTLADDVDKRIRFGIESNQILRDNFSFDKFKQSYFELLKLNN